MGLVELVPPDSGARTHRIPLVPADANTCLFTSHNHHLNPEGRVPRVPFLGVWTFGFLRCTLSFLPMHDFRYVGGKLFCEGVALEALAKKFGTPLYVYSQRTLTNHFQQLDRAMAGVKHLVCFAVK